MTKIIEWIDKRKVWVAFGALAVLVVALVFFRDPLLTVGAAIASGILIVLKEIVAGLGAAKAADALDKLDVTNKKASQKRTDIEKSKRASEVWASVCGMFAAIAGVPAAVAVVEKLVQ